jgi:predicted ferric reductase
MTTQVWWYVARATGIVAWALLAASVVGGLVVSTRLARRRPTPAWQLDLHRFLGGTAVVFTALHVGGLVADSYVDFDAVDVLVPFAASWKPGPVALGVVSLQLLAAIEATSLLKRRLPRRLWRGVHFTSFVLFWSATFHFLLAGTDTANPLALAAIELAAVAVVFLTLVRIFAPRHARTGSRPAAPRAAPQRVEHRVAAR